jgi:hypothetical protein
LRSAIGSPNEKYQQPEAHLFHGTSWWTFSVCWMTKAGLTDVERENK